MQINKNKTSYCDQKQTECKYIEKKKSLRCMLKILFGYFFFFAFLKK